MLSERDVLKFPLLSVSLSRLLPLEFKLKLPQNVAQNLHKQPETKSQRGLAAAKKRDKTSSKTFSLAVVLFVVAASC